MANRGETDLPAPDPLEVRKRNPRKYIGYPIFSEWTATDPDFFILRRFGAVSVRVALALQDKVSELEERLKGLDDFYSSSDSPEKTDNGSYRKDFGNRKKLIEEELPAKLKDYYDFVDAYSRFSNHSRPQTGILQTVQVWFRNNMVHDKTARADIYAIDDLESGYIRCEEDLRCVHKKDKSPFRLLIEKSLVKLPGLKWVFTKDPPEKERIDPLSETTWQNDKSIDIFSWVLFAILTLCMLTGPLWILDKVNGTSQRLGIITGFIGLFFVLVAIATTAKVSEAIGASAAYAAVLMVFLTLGADR